MRSLRRRQCSTGTLRSLIMPQVVAPSGSVPKNPSIMERKDCGFRTERFLEMCRGEGESVMGPDPPDPAF